MMKRFYNLVSVTNTQEGWTILLDGKTIKTPLQNVLYAPTQALANLMMQEWIDQEDDINPETMPLKNKPEID